jgi:hypothetical protein
MLSALSACNIVRATLGLAGDFYAIFGKPHVKRHPAFTFPVTIWGNSLNIFWHFNCLCKVVITERKKGSPLMNLNAQLKQNNQTILPALDYILLQIPDSETGEEYCSGFFQIPDGTSIEPDLYQLVLPDMTEAEILIMRSFSINEEHTAFFSVVGDFSANASAAGRIG